MPQNSQKPPTSPDRLLSAFHGEFKKLHGEISLAAVERKFLGGVAFWEDLHLDAPMALVNRLSDSEFQQRLSDARLVFTAEFQRLLDALCLLTMEDSLTGLFNRRYFDSRLVQEMQRSLRDCSPCSLAMLDIDFFKKINDEHGHQVGDRALAHVASLIRQTLRSSDVTARFGGEEFIIILPNTDASSAQMTGERIRTQLAATPLEVDQVQVEMTISIGITTYTPPSLMTPARLVEQADSAMYKAKRAGRNRCMLHAELPKDPQGVTSEERAALFR